MIRVMLNNAITVTLVTYVTMNIKKIIKNFRDSEILKITRLIQKAYYFVQQEWF